MSFRSTEGWGSLNLLNAFPSNVHLDDRFEIRVGRYLTPLGYDQYAISNYWMPTPERSLFTTNLGLNRQFGAMAWGYLFDKRLDYAAGLFNGSRKLIRGIQQQQGLRRLRQRTAVPGVGILAVCPIPERGARRSHSVTRISRQCPRRSGSARVRPMATSILRARRPCRSSH